MAQIPSTHQNKLKKLAGVLRFAPENDDGTHQAAILLSPSSELTLSVETETSEYVSRESGSGEVLDRSTDRINRSATAVCNQMTDENQALFVIADANPVTQTSTSVTGEVSDYVAPGRTLFLGGAANSGTGVFNLTALTVESYEGANAATHATATTYAVGDVVVPATPNTHWYMATATTTGTSGGSAPTWPTNGGTVVDGGVTWTDMGLIAYTTGTDYEPDAAFGMLNLPSTGAIATAYAKVPQEMRALGRSFRLESAYTRPAATFTQVASNSKGARTGKLWFHEDNAKGENGVWYAPKATLTPNGELALKTEGEYGSMGFNIAFTKPAASPALFRNGIPQ